MARISILNRFYNSGPLILLYYLCISEVDTNLEKIFEIFTLNFQIILIYFWILKRPEIMANGHIFLAGLINDVVMGFPLGISSLSYLIMIFVGTYVRTKSVNTTIASDWFTFLIAMIFSNLLFFSLLNNFSELSFTLSKIGYNMFFTLFMFPIFWFLFNIYQMTFVEIAMLSPSSGNTIIKSKLISRRMFLLTAAKAVVMVGIIGRLVSLQINERTKYKTLSDKNRFREWKLAPERGVIRDFFDQEIASNQQVYQVHLIPENSKDIERLFVRLKTILNITDKRLFILKK